jgi:hypothetical protein
VVRRSARRRSTELVPQAIQTRHLESRTDGESTADEIRA